MTREETIVAEQAALDGDNPLAGKVLHFIEGDPVVLTRTPPPPPPPAKPATPTILTAKPVTSGVNKGKVELTWTEVPGAEYIITRDSLLDGPSKDTKHYAKGGGRVYGVRAVINQIEGDEATKDMGAVPGGEPVPQPKPQVEVKAPVILNTAGASLANVRLTSTDPDAKGITVDAADVTLHNILLDGSRFRYGIFLRPGCRNLRIMGLATTEKIRGDYLYDNGGGRASNVFVDLMGNTLHGSREENGFRIHCKGFTLRNGALPFYDRTDKGVKAGVTIQDGSEDVLLEDLILTGALGIEAILTSSGWQTDAIGKVTLRRVTNAKGRDITIGNAVSDVAMENVTWHQFDPRPLFNIALENPNFAGKKPNLILRNCNFTGGSMLFDNKSRVRLTVEGDVYYNGARVVA